MGRRKDWRRPPYYFVIGMPRGGTSVMMQALIAGGMEAHFTPQNELVAADAAKGFKSNPVDTYEWLQLPARLPKGLRGKLFKMFPWHLEKIEPGPFRAVVIRRERESLLASINTYLDFASQQEGENNREVVHAKKIVEKYEDIEGMLHLLAVTLSYDPRFKSIQEVSYSDVCQRPKEVFGYLKEEGWPIDSEAAAAVVNPNWRNEN